MLNLLINHLEHTKDKPTVHLKSQKYSIHRRAYGIGN